MEKRFIYTTTKSRLSECTLIKYNLNHSHILKTKDHIIVLVIRCEFRFIPS